MKNNSVPNRAIRRKHVQEFDRPIFEEFCKLNGIVPPKLPLSAFKKYVPKWKRVE